MTTLLLSSTAGAFALLWPAVSIAQTPVDCARNPDQARWFVRAGAPGEGAGTNERPFASLADVERCAPTGATITVLAPANGGAPLDGGIRLKERQKLLGMAPPPGGKPAAQLTNSSGTGGAITLAHGSEVAHLHVDNPAGAAILGDNVKATHLGVDSLRNDGIFAATGFLCSGLDQTSKIPACAKLAPAPVSDARIVLNIDRLQFADSLRHGAPNSAGVIELGASDQGRSTIAVHVQRSDITQTSATGAYTFCIQGRPAKDVLDLGCVNPDPAGTSPDPAACRRAGYTSIGQNRIFGNVRNSKTHTPLRELALQGPGAMMAQGNHFGDIAPADGKGDALGECHVSTFDLSADPPPVRNIPNAPCEPYTVPGQGTATGIDAGFRLASDPRPPKK